MYDNQSSILIATVTPANATDPRIGWISSDTSIAKVQSGIVVGVNPGTCILRAYSMYDSTKKAICTVTVNQSILKTLLTSKIQEAQTIYAASVEGTAIGLYTEGSKAIFKTYINSAFLINQSTTSTQAEVDQAVVLLHSAISSFKATLIAVEQIPVTGMKILDGSQKLQIGQSFIFHAQTIPMNATSKQILWNYINANNINEKGTLGN